VDVELSASFLLLLFHPDDPPLSSSFPPGRWKQVKVLSFFILVSDGYDTRLGTYYWFTPPPPFLPLLRCRECEDAEQGPLSRNDLGGSAARGGLYKTVSSFF